MTACPGPEPSPRCWKGYRARISAGARQGFPPPIARNKFGWRRQPGRTPWPICWPARRPLLPPRPPCSRGSRKRPEFVPASLLDIGAGPGTAVPPRSLLASARRHHPAGKQCRLPRPRRPIAAQCENSQPRSARPKPSADLVTAAYVLAEFPKQKPASSLAICGRARRRCWCWSSRARRRVLPASARRAPP